jgi:hypothetical protein
MPGKQNRYGLPMRSCKVLLWNGPGRVEGRPRRCCLRNLRDRARHSLGSRWDSPRVLAVNLEALAASGIGEAVIERDNLECRGVAFGGDDGSREL